MYEIKNNHGIKTLFPTYGACNGYLTINVAVKERFASIETQLNNVRKMVIEGGMGPLSCSSDQIKVNNMYILL